MERTTNNTVKSHQQQTTERTEIEQRLTWRAPYPYMVWGELKNMRDLDTCPSLVPPFCQTCVMYILLYISQMNVLAALFTQTVHWVRSSLSAITCQKANVFFCFTQPSVCSILIQQPWTTTARALAPLLERIEINIFEFRLTPPPPNQTSTAPEFRINTFIMIKYPNGNGFSASTCTNPKLGPKQGRHGAKTKTSLRSTCRPAHMM